MERSRTPASIVVEGVSKRYPGGITALESVDLTVEPGERLVVLGTSGSGKSTLLRLISGLEPISEGRILIGGRDQADVPSHRRDVAMIFQNPSLFPHLSVFENLAFGLRAREEAEKVSSRVIETAATLGLSNLLDRRPDALSGGERQRVAIGRAIAWRPRVLLLDEPFSSLDAPLRASLRDEVVAMHRRFGMTLIHITHDQGEALAIGDRIAILDRGRVVQCDTPRRIYDRPAHRFVAEFVGSPPMNIIPCEIVREPERLVLSIPGPKSTILGVDHETGKSPFPTLKVGERCRLDLGLRPEHLALVRDVGSIQANQAGPSPSARVSRVEYQGHEVWIHLVIGDYPLKARNFGRFPPVEGDLVRVEFRFAGSSWFDPETGLAVVADQNPFAGTDRAC